ncbi:MAG: glutathione S-transferase family protein [Burkholderiales bacterium]|nr:glutathione S-transferase family protein [Burkholderiales bacterium]
MSRPVLVIGNRNYSSWSLRPWVFMRHHGIDFEERRVSLYTEAGKAEIRALSPTGLVPVLIDGGLKVWDSLAILEYVAERHPQARGWPEDVPARAVARSVSAEMHAGFRKLRARLPMNVRRSAPTRTWPAEVQDEIDRVIAIWQDCRARFGQGGPFLFGRFTIADAMYAPVVWRFATYSVPLPATAEAYVGAMHALPAMQAWREAAIAEGEPVPEYDEV